MIVLAMFTDGREHIYDAVPSALAHLDGPFTHRVIFDDSANPSNYRRLKDEFGGLFHIVPARERRGFGGTIANAWRYLSTLDEPFVFHAEDDFIYNRAVDLVSMVTVLDENPDLLQLALRRQPWNLEERAAGGIVEQHPDDYTDRSDRYGNEWLEHRRFFTTNPSLYRTVLCERGWPIVERSEGIFTHQLIDDPHARFGFWGSRHSGEWVSHIGAERAGVGY